MTHRRLHVIHESPEWFAPLAAAFAREGIAVREWLLSESDATRIDLSAQPPPGVYWSRLSAASRTRGRHSAKDYARALLGWVEGSGRRVVGGRAALDLELSRAAQHTALRRHGFDVPRTVAVFGASGLTRAARRFPAPFVVRHNQGGTGFESRRFDSHGELEYFASSPTREEEPTDGIRLLQEHLAGAAPLATRAEFVGGRFVYALRLDAPTGVHDACRGLASGESGPPLDAPALREDLAGHPIIARYEAFLADIGVEIAGIEFAETGDGRLVTTGIDAGAAYRPAVEALAARPATRALVDFFSELTARRAEAAPVA